MERQGYAMSLGRVYRLWGKTGLQVPRKRPRRRVDSGQPRSQPASAANQVWAYDFVFDTTATGQQLKCLTVVDEFTRESLAIDVAGSTRSARVIEVLSQLMSVCGVLRVLRLDNGPEFVSTALLRWASGNGLDVALIKPGRHWQSGVAESFNGNSEMNAFDGVVSVLR